MPLSLWATLRTRIESAFSRTGTVETRDGRLQVQIADGPVEAWAAGSAALPAAFPPAVFHGDAPPDRGELIDVDRLRESALGGPEAERVLIDLFRQQAVELIPSLVRAAADGDLDRLRASAHKLKGSASYVGATHLVGILDGLAHADLDAGPPLSAVEATATAVRAAGQALAALDALASD